MCDWAGPAEAERSAPDYHRNTKKKEKKEKKERGGGSSRCCSDPGHSSGWTGVATDEAQGDHADDGRRK